MAHDYEVRIRRLSEEDGGVYVAEVPELPGCMSDGETPDEAARNVQTAIDAWLAAAREADMHIPAPRLWEEEEYPNGRVSLRLPKSMHRELLQGAERDGVSLNQHVTHLLGVALGMRKIKSSKLGYPVSIRPLAEDKGGGWVAEVPDLPGCASDGETPEEALHNVQDAIDGWLAAAVEIGREIPKPSNQRS